MSGPLHRNPDYRAWPARFRLRLRMLLYCSFWQCISSALARPLQSRSSSDATITNGDSDFHVLANGAQELAALVGLFATDSVERYAIDYTQGFLPPVMAPFSLLGLLGYVRALLKLSLGAEICERTAFSVVALRSYMGVGSGHSSPGEKATEVQYLERRIQKDSVQWKRVKTVMHTKESMPLTAGDGVRAMRDRRTHSPFYGIAMCQLDKTMGTAAMTLGLSGAGLAVATCIPSFTVLLFTSGWTWTRFLATVGLTASVILGGLPWCLVYIIEQLPFEPSEWFRSDWRDGPNMSVTSSAASPGQSLSRKNSLALFVKDDHFYIFDCQAVATRHIWIARAASFVSASLIAIAYICQYIELRATSAKASGVWLGLQGGLAIIRIMAWVWAPNLRWFNNSNNTNTVIRWTDQRVSCFRDSFTELEFVLCWASSPEPPLRATREPTTGLLQRPDALSLPTWLIKHVDHVRLPEAFELAKRIQKGTDISEDFLLLKTASVFWDMPDYIFKRWLQLRCRTYGHTYQYEPYKRHLGVGTWTCRMIKDIYGGMHIVPGVSLLIHSADDRTSPPSAIVYLSHHDDPKLNVLCFPGNPARVGHQRLFKTLDDIPQDDAATLSLALHALHPFYQAIAKEMWNEMLSELNMLYIEAGTPADS
ncbi:MAG: hypothetical protein M1830_008017 [Pleopsidium flavum]|nr:MAG: hypothetical protein M1830_008017 [Pleopsidium flavum]